MLNSNNANLSDANHFLRRTTVGVKTKQETKPALCSGIGNATGSSLWAYQGPSQPQPRIKLRLRPAADQGTVQLSCGPGIQMREQVQQPEKWLKDKEKKKIIIP